MIAPLGLWLDDHPITDIYSLLPFEFPPLLFHDAAAGTALMAGGARLQRHRGDQDVPHRATTVGSAPPARCCSRSPIATVAKRLYRITNPTLLVWGDDDRYVPPPYAEAWRAAIDGAQLEIIPEAGHMVPYEQPGDVAGVIARFFGV